MNIRHIEALARKTLASQPARQPLPAGVIDDDGEFSAVAPSKSGGAARTYILPRSQRAIPFVLAGIALLGAPIVVAGVAVRLIVPDHTLFLNGDGDGTAGGLFTMLLVGVVAAGALALCFLRLPFEIGFTEEPMIEFRSWLRTFTLSPYSLISIRTGGWRDPRAVNVVIKYKGGKMCLSNSFSNFRDFLLTVKSLNPSVEIKGF